jgi:hypothetical protein
MSNNSRFSKVTFATTVALIFLTHCIPARADVIATLRPPSVPLVAHDPYFSIWSPADQSTGADTVHWTGESHRLTSVVQIDGRLFRVLGKIPANVPALPQTSVEVLPTRTIYIFAGEGVQIALTFMTPALPDDLMVYSRPVTYITWTSQATDGREHNVEVRFEASADITVNTPNEEVVPTRQDLTNLAVLKVGSKDQFVLGRKGDNLRINWGWLYLAAPKSEGVAEAHFAETKLPESSRNSAASSVPADSVNALFSFKAVKVGVQPVSRWLMLAYDDEYSVKYFGKNLRPYWRRNGDDAAALLNKSAAEYEALTQRCRKFDAELMADLRRVGGEKYAQLCALACRQTAAGNKVVADANGQPLMFPKENFSNGCISTVDVLFPQAPFFLVFSPVLTKAMLLPILDYAASPHWPYGYAPHDLGTYPQAAGQVYGMGGDDGGRMPVEESGNMLIILAALAQQEGSADWVKPYWPMLTQWADYLVKEGLDPQKQLCSADMFGHLPRNANLALKAIIGIGGHAQLCELAGRPDDAKKYSAIARDYAAKWLELAKDDGHTRLAYDQPGSWSMKHNLIWDRVLGTKLFPDSVGDAEIAWYLKVQKQYGLPVDHRTDTSLIDWALWSIALARNDADFQALLAPIWHYANETPSRVPLADWFNTGNAKQTGFQARPVVGGIFIKLLADPPAWKKWAARDMTPVAGWAPQPTPPEVTVVVPAADTQPALWRYTMNQPANGWETPGFSDSEWRTGKSGFGTAGTPGAVIGTVWSTADIWLRREIEFPAGDWKKLQAWMDHDEDAEVYINGVLALKASAWNTSYDEIPLNENGRAALKPGKNLVAVHCHQTTGGQYIDVGFIQEESK